MSVGLIVDTSVWIDFFGGESIPILEDALALGSVVLPPIVIAELVSGARKASDRAALVDLIDDLPIHAERGAGCDPAPAVHDLVHSLIRDTDRVRQLPLSEPHRLQELLEQDLPRMEGCSMREDPNHPAS